MCVAERGCCENTNCSMGLLERLTQPQLAHRHSRSTPKTRTRTRCTFVYNLQDPKNMYLGGELVLDSKVRGQALLAAELAVQIRMTYLLEYMVGRHSLRLGLERALSLASLGFWFRPILARNHWLALHLGPSPLSTPTFSSTAASPVAPSSVSPPLAHRPPRTLPITPPLPPDVKMIPPPTKPTKPSIFYSVPARRRVFFFLWGAEVGTSEEEH